MRIPTFSRHSGTDTADEQTATGNATPTREPADGYASRGSVAGPTDATTSRWNDSDRNPRRQAGSDEPTVQQPATPGTPYRTPTPTTERDPEHRSAGSDYRSASSDYRTTDESPVAEPAVERTPVVVGPKPRASFLATLGLILGVVAAMLVLSGPLLGYGIGVAVLALILSLSGIHATGRRHVAGKTDALIGMVLSLAAIVVGVLALTGSLNWLGTDMHPVTSVRDWLDANVANRFGR